MARSSAVHAQLPTFTAVLPQAEQPLAEQSLTGDQQPSVPTSAAGASDAVSELVDEEAAVADEQDPVELLTRRPRGVLVRTTLNTRSVGCRPALSAADWDAGNEEPIHVSPPHERCAGCCSA